MCITSSFPVLASRGEGGGISLLEANGDVLPDGAAFSRLD